MAQALLFLAEGFEEIEALTIVDILRRGGVDIQTVSIGSDKLVIGAHAIGVMSDLLFDQAPLEAAQMLILPGGMPGTNNLNAHEGLRKALLAQYSQGKPVAAICAAPMILGQLGMLQGRQATCYPSFEPELKGAQVVDKAVVQDGSIITGNGPGAAIDFALQLLEQLTDKDTRNKIEAGLVRK